MADVEEVEDYCGLVLQPLGRPEQGWEDEAAEDCSEDFDAATFTGYVAVNEGDDDDDEGDDHQEGDEDGEGHEADEAGQEPD